jgi:hypothetical protein
MGRPQLYHTPEEQKAAERARKARYYDRYTSPNTCDCDPGDMTHSGTENRFAGRCVPVIADRIQIVSKITMSVWMIRTERRNRKSDEFFK